MNSIDSSEIFPATDWNEVTELTILSTIIILLVLKINDNAGGYWLYCKKRGKIHRKLYLDLTPNFFGTSTYLSGVLISD